MLFRIYGILYSKIVKNLISVDKVLVADFLKSFFLFIIAFFLWLNEFSVLNFLFKTFFSFIIIYGFGKYLTALPDILVLVISMVSIVYRKQNYFTLIMIVYFISFIYLMSF